MDVMSNHKGLNSNPLKERICNTRQKFSGFFQEVPSKVPNDLLIMIFFATKVRTLEPAENW